MNIADVTLLVVRLLLAAVFLLSGATKLLDLVGTQRALHDFGLPSVLARPVVPLLPGLELATAAALLSASTAWYGAWGALALLTLFLIAIAIAMARGRRPNCHCFGQLQLTPVGWRTLVRNGLLVAGAGWLASKGHRHAGPELWAWFASLDSSGRKIVVIFGCVSGLLFLRQLDRSRSQPEAVEWSFPPDEVEEERPAERRALTPSRRSAPAPPEYVPPAKKHPMGIGLPIGTPAPEFDLPGLTGGTRSLQSLRERGDVLLVFSSPFCESCAVLTANLVRWTTEKGGLPNVVLINVGTARDNLAKLTGFDASRVLLQPEFDVAEMYDCGVTPAAVLVGTEGLIRSALAVGAPAIEQLVTSCAKSTASSADVAATAADTTTDSTGKDDRSNEGPTPSA